MKSLDLYAPQPTGKKEYLQHNGWHFSKKAYLYAVKRMWKEDANGNEQMAKPCTMDEVDEMLTRFNIHLKNDNGYDKCYLKSMAMMDFYGSSIADEQHLAKHIKDVLDDVDGGKERVFRHWYSDMIEDGVSIPWEDIL